MRAQPQNGNRGIYGCEDSRNNFRGSGRNLEHRGLCTPNYEDLEDRRQRCLLYMLSLYVGGVTLWLCYGMVIGARALSLANAASIVFAGTCLVLKFIKARQISCRRQNKRLRIAVDMDETIADTLKEYIRRYNGAFNEGITVAELDGRHVEDLALANRADAVRRLLRDDGFFDCLEVIADAREVLRELVREHDLFIVSSAMEIPESFTAKYRWLRKHFPFISASNIVFCGDKAIVDADYLIDDEARHFRHFRGIGILFSAPHNLNEGAYERVSSWQEVRRKFLGPATTLLPTKHEISGLAAQIDFRGEITKTQTQGD